MPPAPTTSPTASTSQCVPVAPIASAAACEEALEEDSWAVAPGFFLGAMDEEAIDEEDDNEDDTLLILSGLRKRFPQPGAPKMSWYHTATYGAIDSLW